MVTAGIIFFCQRTRLKRHSDEMTLSDKSSQNHNLDGGTTSSLGEPLFICHDNTKEGKTSSSRGPSPICHDSKRERTTSCLGEPSFLCHDTTREGATYNLSEPSSICPYSVGEFNVLQPPQTFSDTEPKTLKTDAIDKKLVTRNNSIKKTLVQESVMLKSSISPCYVDGTLIANSPTKKQINVSSTSPQKLMNSSSSEINLIDAISFHKNQNDKEKIALNFCDDSLLSKNYSDSSLSNKKYKSKKGFSPLKSTDSSKEKESIKCSKESSSETYPFTHILHASAR